MPQLKGGGMEIIMRKKILVFLSVVCLLLGLSIHVFAADKITNVEDVQNEMERFIDKTPLPMKVDGLSISLRNDVDLNGYTEEEICELLGKDLEQMKEIMSSGYYNLIEKPQTRLANKGGGEYTAEVWAGVPAVGWSTVKQDFRASISSGKVKSITFLGDGYMDGVSWGQYNHIRSWYEIYSSSTKVDIKIKGNINYLLNLVNANYEATFLEELEVSGNSLVRQW